MYRWALLATGFCVLVVVLGAFTRLVDAGLGCPDWPGCYGHLTWPQSEAAVERAEATFPEFPVEHDKTWPEMVHRYARSEEHTSELQSRGHLVCRLLLEKKKTQA